ncbi:unnamed protein product [Peronospora belbahrii]|uniref:HhH-GPD domain-containing protein n=1 Tax=Peronospora belbahrii TaxID=622444 RepID=A0AAU9LHY2_9STRA|nr:unnamed protein product [Peronospora belbahrii]CAH0522079.1 unnamed protein product [Peronospora belbahrii]
MLWSSLNEVPWVTIWTHYDDVLQLMQKNDLTELDAWYLVSFPSILQTREPKPYITHEELQRLMEWKLKKGKWRPQLMKFIMSLSEKEVEKASREAFETLKAGDLRTATEALCVLKGVGPATASAVLAAYDESVPFMADEALDAIAGIIGPRKYTLPHFLSFVKVLRAKAKWLNEQRVANNDDKSEATDLWTAQRVQLCLYAEAHNEALTLSTKAVLLDAKRKRHNVATMPLSSEKEVGKVHEEDAKDQSLRRSQRKRQRRAG